MIGRTNANSNLNIQGDLLWSNAVGSQSAFSAQTISLDLSNYNAVIVQFNEYKNRQNVPDGYALVKKGQSSYGYGVGTLSGTQAGARLITAVSDTGIAIGDGYFKATLNNEINIPNAIYGVNVDI